MERRAYFADHAEVKGLNAEALEELKGILETQETTDRDEPGTKIVSDHFLYYIDDDYDVIIMGIK